MQTSVCSAKAFLELYWGELLTRLDYALSHPGSVPDSAAGFVAEMREAWSQVHDAKTHPDEPLLGTFWYAVDTLDDLASIPPVQTVQPVFLELYEQLRQDRVRDTVALMRAKRELPAGFQVVTPEPTPHQLLPESSRDRLPVQAGRQKRQVKG